MGVVFAVLALLVLSIKGISLLDRQPPVATPAESTVPATEPDATDDGEITGQQVAAIAVAMALSESKLASIPAAISRAGATAGSWLQSGRIRALGSSSQGTRGNRK